MADGEACVKRKDCKTLPSIRECSSSKGWQLIRQSNCQIHSMNRIILAISCIIIIDYWITLTSENRMRSQFICEKSRHLVSYRKESTIGAWICCQDFTTTRLKAIWRRYKIFDRRDFTQGESSLNTFERINLINDGLKLRLGERYRSKRKILANRWKAFPRNNPTKRRRIQSNST